MDKKQISLGNTLLLGDSYSTFVGYIPEGYPPYYGPNDDIENGGVGKVEKTWWHMLVSECGGNLVMNNSFSGSTVCDTCYNNEYTPNESFVGRLINSCGHGFDPAKIDTFLLFGGTNDSWAGSPVGELQYEDWNSDDLRSFAPAFCRILDFAREKMPQARIINIASDELSDAVREKMYAACEHYGVRCVVLSGIDKHDGHPTIIGMRQVTDAVINALD